MRQSRTLRLSLRALATVYLGLLVAVPVTMILVRALAPGLRTWWQWVTTPAAISALNLTLLIIAIVVPLNVVFGVITALALARGRFPGRAVLQTLVDLPFAVSPVVVGVAMIALWGTNGWFGWLPQHGIRVVYALPAMVLATSFVTMPFVVREVEPVLRELGTDQEQAAATLGASRFQVFSRITLPAIRWGLTYGVVLTISRALGEYGAVLLVSSNLPGVSQTLTLLVHGRFVDDHNVYGAYAASTVLMGLALVTLLVTTLLDHWKKQR
ncbi:sulfate transport system permease protein [Raineyella antarctica]|uniref:Sulfate transport system permease protein n=1 Tax=Raineyella antarctica TaxID=1577474 RepID=A0A1G6GEP1_9ACTN|nr:sulfate ABC transporter permease subunit [Raineyella antarctica]SDB80369.1 sulfate transport system permease protein [Raineyella antarctica]